MPELYLSSFGLCVYFKDLYLIVSAPAPYFLIKGNMKTGGEPSGFAAIQVSTAYTGSSDHTRAF
jgi:hypothetical protein